VEAACPNCGAPLYLFDAPSQQAKAEVGSAVGVADVPVETEPAVPDARPEERGIATTDDPDPSRRSFPVAGPIVAVGLVLAFLLGLWLGPGEEFPAPAASDAPVEETPDEGGDQSAAAVHVRTRVRRTPNVDGIPFSFVVPTSWERHDFTITRSVVGPQGAEGIIFWTTVPNPTHVQACGHAFDGGIGSSVADLAASIASAPGTARVDGSSDATVDGRVARHVALRVLKADGCQPGFFFRWPHHPCIGACWMQMEAGNTIDVWIVRVSGETVLFEAATTRGGTPELDEDIERIVSSIRFDA
jgi:hypothetical protein